MACAIRIVPAFLATLIVALALTPGAARADSDPVVDQSRSTQRLNALPRSAGAKKVVTIYDFRSSVGELPARGATDMFTTALIKSGSFAVAERNRMNEGVMLERQLNGSGLTTGTAASKKLAGADYIFEGTISESNQGARQTNNGVSIGGMNVQSATNVDEIGIDVRIIDASSGLVLDSVNVRKRIESSQSGVSNVGSLLGAVASMRGRNIPIPVDANVSSGRKESLDKALRACIETAVLELVTRYGQD
jgi:curli biogenesis system outer membrane secretion channel CsgG